MLPQGVAISLFAFIDAIFDEMSVVVLFRVVLDVLLQQKN